MKRIPIWVIWVVVPILVLVPVYLHNQSDRRQHERFMRKMELADDEHAGTITEDEKVELRIIREQEARERLD